MRTKPVFELITPGHGPWTQNWNNNGTWQQPKLKEGNIKEPIMRIFVRQEQRCQLWTIIWAILILVWERKFLKWWGILTQTFVQWTVNCTSAISILRKLQLKAKIATNYYCLSWESHTICSFWLDCSQFINNYYAMIRLRQNDQNSIPFISTTEDTNFLHI